MRNIFILQLLIVLLIGSSCSEEEVKVVSEIDYQGYWEISSEYVHATDHMMTKEELHELEQMVFGGLKIYKDGEQTFMLDKKWQTDESLSTILFMLEIKETGEVFVRDPDRGIVLPYFLSFDIIDDQLVINKGHDQIKTTTYFDRIPESRWVEF